MFYSKSLSPVEQNYEIHDKEMLAIIRALEEWRHFLEGAQHLVEIWTDHKNLEYFMTAKKLNHRQARWSLYLARFDFKLTHHPGRCMGKPDVLSQRLDVAWGSPTCYHRGWTMAREPPTTKTWFSYNRSSWQSEPSKESRWRDRRRIFLRKFVKGTREATRKSQ